MIMFYKNIGPTIQIVNEEVPGMWVNVVDPTPAEMNRLQEMGIPHDYLVYSLDIDERPRTERENGDIFILLRIPSFQGAIADIPYTTIPIGIILTEQHLATVCKCDNDVLQELATGRVKGMSTGKRNRFILQVLLRTATMYLNYLRQITRMVDGLEDQLQRSTRNREVLELLKYQKSLTIFTTALKSNELMLRRLQQSQMFKAYPEDEDLLDDVLTETQQAIEMTNIQSSILSGMMDAFASIISNNLNAVMKFLASITIIASVPSIVSSFFGMNVNIPLDELPFAFALIVALSLAVTSIVVILFIKRDWL